MNDMVKFSGLIQIMGKRYPKFRAMLDNCDAQIFLSIPALVVLYSLDSIVTRFAPQLLPTVDTIHKKVTFSNKRNLIELDLLEQVDSGVAVV